MNDYSKLRGYLLIPLARKCFQTKSLIESNLVSSKFIHAYISKYLLFCVKISIFSIFADVVRSWNLRREREREREGECYH
jgi:hypothetical protein